MSISYSHIQQYEKEILKLHEKGLSQKEIGERLGFSKDQVKRFVHRYHEKGRKFKAGIAIHKKGRPPKDAVVNRADKVSELKYILARKETKIK